MIFMPELPEVETIKSQLSKLVPIKIIQVKESIHAKSIILKNEFEVKNKIIISIKRYGKILFFNLSDECYIISGLGMTGSWRISESPITETHKHFEYICEKNDKKFFISYVDPRRFGYLYYVKKEEFQKFLKKFGPDPTSAGFTAEYIYNSLRRYPERKLKPFLLDQKFFPGIGNYMASEICARAGILPTKLARKISKSASEKIKLATDSLLNQSIKNHGVTFAGGYKDANGANGEGLSNLVVFYQEICGLCKKEKVKKIFLSGRGTYYCPKCQK
jgi:formamidopyrimidine-DNA glycosylase